jgi:hypothetical protein
MPSRLLWARSVNSLVDSAARETAPYFRPMIASALPLVNFAHVDLFGDLWAILTGYAAIIDNESLARNRTGAAPVQRQGSGPDKRDRHCELHVREPTHAGVLAASRHEGFESVNRPGYWFQLLL